MSKVLHERSKTDDMYFSVKGEEVERKLRLLGAAAFPGLSVDLRYDTCCNPGKYWFFVKLTDGISRNFYPIHMSDGIKGSGIGLLMSELYP